MSINLGTSVAALDRGSGSDRLAVVRPGSRGLLPAIGSPEFEARRKRLRDRAAAPVRVDEPLGASTARSLPG